MTTTVLVIAGAGNHLVKVTVMQKGADDGPGIPAREVVLGTNDVFKDVIYDEQYLVVSEKKV